MIRAKTPDATIVALHTTADPDAILSAMRAGVNEYVYPPLEGALRGALERRSTDGRRHSGMRGAARTIGFFSSKGGCGATTVVCHLAVELGRHGQKVLLADLDLDAGLIGFLTKAKPGYSILDAVNNLHRMDVSYWKALVSNGIPGVEIIAAPAATADKTYPRQEQLRQLFSFLRSLLRLYADRPGPQPDARRRGRPGRNGRSLPGEHAGSSGAAPGQAGAANPDGRGLWARTG